MERTIRLPVLAFITGIAFGVIISGQIAGAQQQPPIKRTDLLKTIWTRSRAAK